jgi:D-sedoheptulose 7-phosphate isomerase
MTQPIPLWQDATSGSGLLSSHVDSLARLLSGLDLTAIEQAGNLLDQVTQNGGTVYTAGNGGSAATALHIAADLSWGRRMGDQNRPRAISLAANSPIMTALANDVSFDEVFTEQMISLFREGDLLVVISASGNSENVVRAAQFANDHGGSTIAMVGFDGGKLNGTCDVNIHVPTPLRAYELVEDVHHSICHMMANYLKFQAAARGKSGS